MLNKAQEISSQIVDWWKDFHMHPKLSFHPQTVALIEAVSRDLVGAEHVLPV